MEDRRSFIEECVEDLDHAISELGKALGDQPRQRRAVKAVVNELYRLQAYRCEPGGSATPYFGRANSIAPGRVTEGIIFLSGILTHRITRPVAPVGGRGTYPGKNLYPPFYPRRSLSWIGQTEMSALFPDAGSKGRFFNERSYSFYLSHVADRPVLDTVRIARDFLVNDAVLGPLL